MHRTLAGSFKHLSAAAALAVTFGGNANAATFDFGSATVDVSDVATQFSLSTATWPSSWGTNAFIGALAVNSGAASSATVTNGSVSGGGVSTVGVSPGSGPGGDFDFRFTLGQGSADRMGQQESVNWEASGVTGGVSNIALHVQGLDTNNFPGGSIWLFTGGNTTPVPEPGTYALFLVGLLGIGFLMRKRVSRFALPA